MMDILHMSQKPGHNIVAGMNATVFLKFFGLLMQIGLLSQMSIDSDLMAYVF